MKAKKILFFPGKDTPIKRYVSYFPMLSLEETSNFESSLILCHSIGLKNAMEYCIKNQIRSTIISMDGVKLEENSTEIKIICFRPNHKTNIGDESLYHKIYYYDIGNENSHHPYRDKNVRNKIVKCIEF